MVKDNGRKKKQRIRSPHPGVKVLRRERASRVIYLARWTDPDTGRPKEVSLTKLKRTTAESRKQWAINKSNSIAERRAALKSGTAIVSNTTPAKAVESYFKTRKHELKDSTIKVYREATDPFLRWAKSTGLTRVEDLTPPRLTALRDWLVGLPRHVQKRGAGNGRGARRPSKRRRSPSQINKVLRSMRTVLNHWRKRGLTPELTSDSIRDLMEYVKAPKPLPRFLRSGEIRALVEACRRHDAETYDYARRGRAQRDSKRHYPAITPFAVAALLSGMRFGELAELRWADVDLEAGEIRLTHTTTKTGHGRVVGLAESPALLALLKRMKLKADRSPYVFGFPEKLKNGRLKHSPMKRDVAESARKRLQGGFGAPAKWTWHDLRRTCGTFLTCAPSIYGAASTFLSAKRLGHSVAVAEKHYLGAVSNVSPDATTLEDAMGIADLLVDLPVAGEFRSTA